MYIFSLVRFFNIILKYFIANFPVVTADLACHTKDGAKESHERVVAKILHSFITEIRACLISDFDMRYNSNILFEII